MIISRSKFNITWITVFFLVVILALQNPLEVLWPSLKWIDELMCVILFLLSMLIWRRSVKRRSVLSVLPLLVFVICCLLGNLLFRYQPLDAVVIDAIANLKFWISLFAAYLLSGYLWEDDAGRAAVTAAKILSAILFVLFVMERFGIVFTGGERSGPWSLPCAQMFFFHPTYLVGTMVFLLAIFLARWETSLLPFACMDLLVMVFTFRSKAYGAAVAFAALLIWSVLWRKRIHIWQVVIAAIALVAIAWEKVYFYYVFLAGRSARSIMTSAGFQAMKDHFPFGTGFATFASYQAGVYYSPLYYKYNIFHHYNMGVERREFLSDTFWPIIVAQSGFIGLCAYVAMLLLLLKKAWRLHRSNFGHYAMALFCIAYLLISSTSEPTFNNPVSLPLAVCMGYAFAQADKKKAANAVQYNK